MNRIVLRTTIWYPTSVACIPRAQETSSLSISAETGRTRPTMEVTALPVPH